MACRTRRTQADTGSRFPKNRQLLVECGRLRRISSLHMKITHSRRDFIRSSAAAGLGLSALGLQRARAASPNGKLRVLSIGVVGTIGEADRQTGRRASRRGNRRSLRCRFELSRAGRQGPSGCVHLQRLPRGLCEARRQVRRGDRLRAGSLARADPANSHGPRQTRLWPETARPPARGVGDGRAGDQGETQSRHPARQPAHGPSRPPRRRGNPASGHARQGHRVLRLDQLAGPRQRISTTTKFIKEDPNIPANLDWDLWLGPSRRDAVFR